MLPRAKLIPGVTWREQTLDCLVDDIAGLQAVDPVDHVSTGIAGVRRQEFIDNLSGIDTVHCTPDEITDQDNANAKGAQENQVTDQIGIASPSHRLLL
jgi:hypothetical protein